MNDEISEYDNEEHVSKSLRSNSVVPEFSKEVDNLSDGLKSQAAFLPIPSKSREP